MLLSMLPISAVAVGGLGAYIDPSVVRTSPDWLSIKSVLNLTEKFYQILDLALNSFMTFSNWHYIPNQTRNEQNWEIIIGMSFGTLS
jgi:hypothetical protein